MTYKQEQVSGGVLCSVLKKKQNRKREHQFWTCVYNFEHVCKISHWAFEHNFTLHILFRSKRKFALWHNRVVIQTNLTGQICWWNKTLMAVVNPLQLHAKSRAIGMPAGKWMWPHTDPCERWNEMEGGRNGWGNRITWGGSCGLGLGRGWHLPNSNPLSELSPQTQVHVDLCH